MSETLGKNEEARKWARLADERKANIDKYLWNEKAGMFFDYNFAKQTAIYLRLRHRFLSAVGGISHSRPGQSSDEESLHL